MWFIILCKQNKKFLESVLKEGEKIEEDLIKVIPEKIDDKILDFLENFHVMEKYFDSDAWLVLLSSMKSKKEQCTCPTCDTLISETVANCST